LKYWTCQVTEKDVDEALERLAKAMEVVSRSQRSFTNGHFSVVSNVAPTEGQRGELLEGMLFLRHSVYRWHLRSLFQKQRNWSMTA
jgi:hypothetical protein